jgi:hypothetical protein
MKLGDDGIDELFQTVQFLLEDDGGLYARLKRRWYLRRYRGLRLDLLRDWKRSWRRGAVDRESRA